jgi:class 3 adenylate cyclase
MEVQLHTFLFADISGYSTLTELEGDEAAAEAAISFAAEVSRLAAEHQTDVVRRIGDAVMVHGLNAAETLELGLRLQTVSWHLGLPPVHTGIHTGPALEREGDWWGATVNVTARVAAAAEAGQLLVTEPAKLAAGELNDANFTALGALQLKNISAPVPVYSLARREAHVYLLYSRKGSALVARAETGLALAKTGLGGERGLYDLPYVLRGREGLGADAAY